MLDKRIPDMPTLDLPSRSFRNRPGNDDLFWDLELGNLPLKAFLDPFLFLFIIPAIPRFEDDAGPDNLTVLGVINAKAYSLSYTLDREENSVNLQGRELLATAIDEFFEATCELQLAARENKTLVPSPLTNFIGLRSIIWWC